MAYNFRNFITEKCIQIPRLQREFAFGRVDPISKGKRTRFLDAIFDTITSKEQLYLNFIYGTSDGNYFYPLDGQQRLTILFLLYWYVINKTEPDNELLVDEKKSRFMYDTRYSSTMFFQELVHFKYQGGTPVVDQIKDEAWFELAWQYDGNISGCLEVLAYIDEKARDLSISVSDIDAITFDVIDIDAYEMSDDIYIKINSRGKQLTEFENFKSAFLEKIKSLDMTMHKRIAGKFDDQWTKIFWQFVDLDAKETAAQQLDAMIFNYVRYISQVLIWEKSLDNTIDVNQGYSLISNVGNIFQSVDDFIYFEKWFDIFSSIDDIDTWCSERFYYEKNSVTPTDTSKIRLWTEQNPNLLKNLAKGDSSRNSEALFYALAVYLMNKDKIEGSDFLLRFRSVRNLLESGAKTAYNNMLRYSASANDMTGAFKQVKMFVLGEDISNIKGSYRLNLTQMKYEQNKNAWLNEHPEYLEIIVKLEDNDKIHGNTANIGFENPDEMQHYTDLVSGDNLSFTRSLLAFCYHFPTKSNEATYFPTNTSNNSNFFRGPVVNSKVKSSDRNERTRDEEMLAILRDNDLSAILAMPETVIRQCKMDNCFPPEYYALAYPKFYIENNKEFYEYGNVRYFSAIGLCLTNKSISQWHSYRNSILLTIDALTKYTVEWLDDNSGIMWGNDIVLKSTQEGFQLIKADQTIPIIVTEPNGQYDTVDRVQRGLQLIRENR